MLSVKVVQHCSSSRLPLIARTIVGSNIAFGKKKDKNPQNKSEQNVSFFLRKHVFGVDKPQDFEKVKHQMIGLSINDNLEVKNSNVEFVLWQEIINQGSVKIGIDLYNQTDNYIIKNMNMLTLLKNASESEILKHEEFVTNFAVDFIRNNTNKFDNNFWKSVHILSRTSNWRDIAEYVAKVHIDHSADSAGTTVMADYNEIGNFNRRSKVVLLIECPKKCAHVCLLPF